MARTGILGGAFDPVHNGHLALARAALDAGLDRIIFVPTGTPPHKDTAGLTEGRHRAAMVRLAIAGEPLYSVSDYELSRSVPSFTIDTLEHLSKELPKDELFFIIGSDSLLDLPEWREPERIRGLARLMVAGRPGYPAKGMEEGDVALPGMVPMDISATDIRHAAADGRPIEGLVPAAVANYIRSNKLYSP